MTEVMELGHHMSFVTTDDFKMVKEQCDQKCKEINELKESHKELKERCKLMQKIIEKIMWGEYFNHNRLEDTISSRKNLSVRFRQQEVDSEIGSDNPSFVSATQSDLQNDKTKQNCHLIDISLGKDNEL